MLAIVALTIAAPATPGDGVLEIAPACVANGCFPEDTGGADLSADSGSGYAENQFDGYGLAPVAESPRQLGPNLCGAGLCP